MLVVFLSLSGLVAFAHSPLGHRVWVKLVGAATVGERVEQHGPAAWARWRGHGLAEVPAAVTLVVLKEEKRVEVWADGRLVRIIPATAMSGGPGPKRRRGDRQVPEGVYGLESLNPNSRFHLALRIDYPNTLDRDEAEAGVNLGGDIMIHGGAASVGCVAVGDEAAEDLFVLAAEVRIENVELLMLPRDLRKFPPSPTDAEVGTRYDLLRQRLEALGGGE